MKWWRSVAALPKPTSVAIHSIERSDCSSSAWATWTRWARIQPYGVVPVSSLNLRAKVRADMWVAREEVHAQLLAEVALDPLQQGAASRRCTRARDER